MESIQTLQQKKAKLEEVVGVCVCGSGKGAVLTPAFCPDDGPAREERRCCHTQNTNKDVSRTPWKSTRGSLVSQAAPCTTKVR